MDVPIVYRRLVDIASMGLNPINMSTGVRTKPPPMPKKPDSILMENPIRMNNANSKKNTP
jgi:hypothetical protein